VAGFQILENQTCKIDSTELAFFSISAITIVLAAQNGDVSYPIHCVGLLLSASKSLQMRLPKSANLTATLTVPA